MFEGLQFLHSFCTVCFPALTPPRVLLLRLFGRGSPKASKASGLCNGLDGHGTKSAEGWRFPGLIGLKPLKSWFAFRSSRSWRPRLFGNSKFNLFSLLDSLSWLCFAMLRDPRGSDWHFLCFFTFSSSLGALGGISDAWTASWEGVSDVSEMLPRPTACSAADCAATELCKSCIMRHWLAVDVWICFKAVWINCIHSCSAGCSEISENCCMCRDFSEWEAADGAGGAKAQKAPKAHVQKQPTKTSLQCWTSEILWLAHRCDRHLFKGFATLSREIGIGKQGSHAALAQKIEVLWKRHENFWKKTEHWRKMLDARENT